MNQQLSLTQQEQALRSFLPRVYLWMFAALLVTAAVAWTVYGSETLREIFFTNPWITLGLFVAQIALVIALSAAISKLSPVVATLIFFGYAALTGIVFSSIFLAYTQTSIASTFVATAGMFGVMSIIGLTTGMDLTKVGNIAFMALIGIIIASLINFFLRSEALYWVISIVGVLVFIVLIARDTQKLKEMALKTDINSEQGQKTSLMGALILYLDFINLFLFLLRLFGRSR
ncbi:MAG: Bax inhibitor-1/YccA family protein [Anaerolineae bacterium]|nr:Bax inhibitor-1/YccA family protein [Anaerolineae bacterium]